MHTKRHKKGNAAKRKERRKKEGIKVWLHGRGVDKIIVV